MSIEGNEFTKNFAEKYAGAINIKYLTTKPELIRVIADFRDSYDEITGRVTYEEYFSIRDNLFR